MSSSPIKYREKPLEYEPGVYCHCSAKAPRWISWSDKNPGRRYYTCENARFGGCKFFLWHEELPTPFLCQLLLDLRDTVYNLKIEKNAMKKRLDEAVQTVGARTKELQLQYKEVSHFIIP